MRKKLIHFLTNPIRLYTAIAALQGMWLVLMAYDAYTDHWVNAAIHTLALGVNTYSLHLSRRTMFMVIWNAATQYNAQHATCDPPQADSPPVPPQSPQ